MGYTSVPTCTVSGENQAIPKILEDPQDLTAWTPGLDDELQTEK